MVVICITSRSNTIRIEGAIPDIQDAIRNIATYYDRLQLSYDSCLSTIVRGSYLAPFNVTRQTCIDFIQFWRENCSNDNAFFWAVNYAQFDYWQYEMRYFYYNAEDERSSI